MNQDDIYHRHLFYSDDKGTTGSAITFFEWPDLPHGQVGLASPHHLAYTVPRLDALPEWKAWLLSQGLSVVGPLLRDERISLYLRDPDGVIVEITSPNREAVSIDYIHELSRNFPSVKGITPDMRLTTFNHASPITTDPQLTVRFLNKLLRLKNYFTLENPDQENTAIVAVGNEQHPDFLRYLASSRAQDGYVGRGSIHHIAMAVEDEEDQRQIMRHLNNAGVGNSGIINRFWFRSLYFRDPDGNLLEVATKGPGYAADESMDSLGTRLVLPAWLEHKRPEIEARLTALDRRNAGEWPPKYPPVHTPPESLMRASVA